MTAIINAIKDAATAVSDIVTIEYDRWREYKQVTVDTRLTGPFVVRVSQAKMPQSCYVGAGNRYERIAILRLTDGYHGPIPTISRHNKAVANIVSVRDKLFRGKSDRCIAAKVQADMQDKCDVLNAAWLRRDKRRQQAALRRDKDRSGSPRYYRGATSRYYRGNLIPDPCCNKKHRTYRAAQRCVDSQDAGYVVYGYDHLHFCCGEATRDLSPGCIA